ncbi:DNA-binding protein HU-beta [hydrothermal vent metagenome]|uniref:DNA-binding protein HU-beta n=1 Tax=hydrothermal vent metagenome TaxID=652676 RepID=A0A3B1BRC5_9ZZZZ
MAKGQVPGIFSEIPHATLTWPSLTGINLLIRRIHNSVPSDGIFFITPLGGYLVNKAELIDAVAENADISKAAAARAVDTVLESITATLKKGEQVALIGFGTFSVKDRAARTGRNPRTGEPLEIPAAKVPSFKAGKALKDAVN